MSGGGHQEGQVGFCQAQLCGFGLAVPNQRRFASGSHPVGSLKPGGRRGIVLASHKNNKNDGFGLSEGKIGWFGSKLYFALTARG